MLLLHGDQSTLVCRQIKHSAVFMQQLCSQCVSTMIDIFSLMELCSHYVLERAVLWSTPQNDVFTGSFLACVVCVKGLN